MSRFEYLLGSSSNAAPVAVSGNSNAFNTQGLGTVLINAVVSNLTSTAGAFTAAVTDILTKAAHGFQLGQVVQVSNSGGALPTGLSASTDYFVIPINGDTFYLATSYNNAIAGTHIDITGAGSGTNTVTPTALAAGNATLQSAQGTPGNPGTPLASTWLDVPNTEVAISGLGSFNFSIRNVDFPFYRLAIDANTAGVLGLAVTASGE